MRDYFFNEDELTFRRRLDIQISHLLGSIAKRCGFWSLLDPHAAILFWLRLYQISLLRSFVLTSSSAIIHSEVEKHTSVRTYSNHFSLQLSTQKVNKVEREVFFVTSGSELQQSVLQDQSIEIPDIKETFFKLHITRSVRIHLCIQG